jgi:opacity protein-like surface antigen
VRLSKTLTVILVAAVGIAAVPISSLGQGLADFDLTLFGGGSMFSEESFDIGPPQASPPIPWRFKVSSNFVTGIRLNIVTGTKWGLEPYYSYAKADASYIQADDSTYRLDLPIQVHGFGVSYLYYPWGNGYPFADNRNKITPFLIGGVGAAIFRPTSQAKNLAEDPLLGNLGEIIESNKASFHYGVGAKYRLTRELAVRVDTRGILSGNPTFGFPTQSDNPNDTVIPLEGMIHNLEISFGISINFGSRP